MTTILSRIFPDVKRLITENKQLLEENKELRSELDKKQLHINQTNEYWKKKYYGLQKRTGGKTTYHKK